MKNQRQRQQPGRRVSSLASFMPSVPHAHKRREVVSQTQKRVFGRDITHVMRNLTTRKTNASVSSLSIFAPSTKRRRTYQKQEEDFDIEIAFPDDANRRFDPVDFQDEDGHQSDVSMYDPNEEEPEDDDWKCQGDVVLANDWSSDRPFGWINLPHLDYTNMSPTSACFFRESMSMSPQDRPTKEEEERSNRIESFKSCEMHQTTAFPNVAECTRAWCHMTFVGAILFVQCLGSQWDLPPNITIESIFTLLQFMSLYKRKVPLNSWKMFGSVAIMLGMKMGTNSIIRFESMAKFLEEDQLMKVSITALQNCEKQVFQELDFNLVWLSPLEFLGMIIEILPVARAREVLGLTVAELDGWYEKNETHGIDENLERSLQCVFLAQYLIEISMLHVASYNFLPSKTATAAMYISLVMHDVPLLEEVESVSGYEISDLRTEIKHLIRVARTTSLAEGKHPSECRKYNVNFVYDKYGSKDYFQVADFDTISTDEFFELADELKVGI